MGELSGDIEQLRVELDGARAALLASFEGITQAAFERVPEAPADDPADQRWSVRDVLWHAGLLEDWVRRTVDAAVNGREVKLYAHRDRPAIATTPEYLGEWLEQCRRPMLALLRRLPDDALDRPFTLPDGSPRMPRLMLAYVAAHDLEHVAQIEALREIGRAHV